MYNFTRLTELQNLFSEYLLHYKQTTHLTFQCIFSKGGYAMNFII